MSKRKSEITLINVFLCLAVVMIHLVSRPLADTKGAPIYMFYMPLTRLLSFVVQGFIFLSGMKLFLNNRRTAWLPFLENRAGTVVIPYIIAVAAYYYYFVHRQKWLIFSWGGFFGYIFRGDIAAHFYFVIAIIQFYLLYPLWRMIANRARPGKAIAISAIITLLMLYSPFIEDRITGGWSFWYYDRLFPTYMIYWVGGMFAGIYYDKFMAFTKDFRAYLFMIAIAAGIADVVVLYMRQHGIISSLHADAVHALYCCAVIPACFPAAWYIRHISDMLLVRMVDTSSYYIYLFHVLLIFILDNNWLAEHGDWGITSVTRLFSVRCAIVYAEVFLMAFIIWAVKRLRNKTQMFPAS